MRLELLQVVIGHLGRVGSDLNGYQDFLHSHRRTRRLSGSALSVGDSDLGSTVGQDGGGHGVSGHVRGDAIAIAGSYHHTSGVKALPGLISCLDRGLGDIQTLQFERAVTATAGQIEYLADIGVFTHSVSTSSRRIFTVRSMSGVTSHRNITSPSFTTLSALMPVSLQSM